MNISTWLFSSVSRGDMTKDTNSRKASYGGVAENVCALSSSESVVLCLVSATAKRDLTSRRCASPFVHVYPFGWCRTFSCRFQAVVERIILVSVQLVDQEPHLRDYNKIKPHPIMTS